MKVMRRLGVSGPSVPGPRPGGRPAPAGDPAPVHRRREAARGGRARCPGRRGRPSASWLLLRCARPASHVVSPGRGPNLVPFSILEPLLRIKNQSNDGKASE